MPSGRERLPEWLRPEVARGIAERGWRTRC
jgi:hypothetical protein